MRIFKIAGSFAVVVTVLVAVNHLQPERLTAERLNEAAETQKKLDEAAAESAPQTEKEKPVEQKPAADANDEAKNDPNVFKVKFETTAGDFVMEIHRDWAPIGAARFEELVKANYYDGNRFFRVIPGFVVQFGLNGDPEVTAQWEAKRIKDEPVKQTNAPGTVTFAKSSLPNSRTTQLFINTGSNARLDGMGFSPFGKVVEGLEVVKNINAEYGEQPNQGLINAQGNAYLEKAFPRLDYVKTARIVE